MGLPVTVYRSTDVGAPQLDGTILSLLVVIQKVLVDGYGQKLGLGWTRLFFDDTAGAVIYRNNISEGGSGGVVRFNATNGISTLNTSINIQVAKDASSLNALFHKSPSIYRYVQSSALVWEIIGTGRGFYMSISPSTIPRLGYSTVLQWTQFLGDITPYWPNDAGTFVMVTGSPLSSDSTTTSDSFSIGGTNSLYAMLYNTDGVNNMVAYKCDTPSWIYSTSNAAHNNATPIEDNMLVTLTPMVLGVSSPFNVDTNNLPIIQSKVSQCVEGK